MWNNRTSAVRCAQLQCVFGAAYGKCSLPRPGSTWMWTIRNSSTPKCCVNWSADAVEVVFSYRNRNRRSLFHTSNASIQYYNHARGNCLLLYVRYVLLVSFDLLALWMPFSTLIVCRPPAGKCEPNKMCSIEIHGVQVHAKWSFRTNGVQLGFWARRPWKFRIACVCSKVCCRSSQTQLN